MIRLAELLSENHTVFVYAQEKYKHNTQKIHICKNLEEISNADKIIAGIPLSKDKETLYLPYSETQIKLEELRKLIKNKTFIAGGVPKDFFKESKIIDLLDLEELTVLNAIPTAEGAIKIAIEETEFTIHESNILICGYGRIGKMLCKRLQALGANVYCTVRKQEEVSWLKEAKIQPIFYAELENNVSKMDIIINTVPANIITENIIKNLQKNCVIIDLASLPGGVDKNAAKLYNKRVITALGLPGKVAPLTAANYIKTIIEKLN